MAVTLKLKRPLSQPRTGFACGCDRERLEKLNAAVGWSRDRLLTLLDRYEEDLGPYHAATIRSIWWSLGTSNPKVHP